MQTMGRIIRLCGVLFALSSFVILPLEALSGRLNWVVAAFVALAGLCIAAMLFGIGNRMVLGNSTPEINQLQLTPGSFQERFWRQSPRLRMGVYISLLGFAALLFAGVILRFLQGQSLNLSILIVMSVCGHAGITGLSREREIARQKVIDQLRGQHGQ
jgi:hypothetical protein